MPHLGVVPVLVLAGQFHADTWQHLSAHVKVHGGLFPARREEAPLGLRSTLRGPTRGRLNERRGAGGGRGGGGGIGREGGGRGRRGGRGGRGGTGGKWGFTPRSLAPRPSQHRHCPVFAPRMHWWRFSPFPVLDAPLSLYHSAAHLAAAQPIARPARPLPILPALPLCSRCLLRLLGRSFARHELGGDVPAPGACPARVVLDAADPRDAAPGAHAQVDAAGDEDPGDLAPHAADEGLAVGAAAAEEKGVGDACEWGIMSCG